MAKDRFGPYHPGKRDAARPFSPEPYPPWQFRQLIVGVKNATALQAVFRKDIISPYVRQVKSK